MNTYRVVGRPLLASMFVGGGLDAVRHPETKVKKAEPIVVPLARLLPAGHDDPALLVRINGAVQVGAGLLLASGRYPRLTAATLIGSLVPTTYAGHRFWEEADDVARAQQQIHFLKNLGLLGGLLLALDDGGRSGTGAARSRRSA
ncbi:MAG: DoxX family protein, partial [Acidimicrobiales bacterium]